MARTKRGQERPPDGALALRVRVARSLDEVDRGAWDGLEHAPSPFLSWGFLRALELSGSIGPGSGWHPFYLLAEEEESGTLVAAVPTFVKSHSYGEYIFDWAWASASERAGIPYYPKLVVAAPVTPATGHRILIRAGIDPEPVTEALAGVVRDLAEDAGCSSIHWLFCTAEEQARLARLGFAPRASFQFHWHNRDYGCFDDFLATLKSRKRKQLRKERRRARDEVDAIEMIPGGDLSRGQIDTLDRLYRQNTFLHGGMDYLQPGFFHRLAEQLPDTMLLCDVRRGSRTIATALFLETDQALYGRYWGCAEEHEFLHFETAYYSGIDRCIERGLPLFEAGAQGQHKLLRGFEPSPTYSAHWLADPRLDAAIRDFLEVEQLEVEARMAQLADHLPYRAADDD